ncbi:regulatory protein TetR [Cupriavidus basilensis OR16]|uniref:Regulatory protein TetR n=1 Tax=Cupriavidus basilensis OR16 TaxID=1127483 RepID=H1S4W9_9BURK|nr:TetR/AcrR family transcriptional regulator [Cupriavidus basilensis]EHP42453.1 regulatory protein TetR [Cupriavidus basilensis OR16]
MTPVETRRPKTPARKPAAEPPAATASASRAAEASGRQRLIEAAEIEFTQKGYDGASVLSIANRAGVKQPLLNYHFGSKEGLWRAVVENAYTGALTASGQAADARDPADPLARLQAALRAFAVSNILHPAAHSLVLMEVAQDGPRLDWLVDNYMKPFHDKLDALIAQCHAAQLLKPYPPEHASVTMTATLTAVQSATHLIQRLYGVGPMTAEQAGQHAEQVIDVLLNGMLARPASRRRTASAR